MADLKLGDSLYRYVRCGGIFHYKVVGTRTYEDGVLYEVETQSCNHYGEKCRLLIAKTKTAYRYVSMTNDNEEDSQEYWHTDDTQFHTIKEKAELDLINANLSIVQKNLATAEDRVRREKESLKRYQELADVAKGKMKNVESDSAS